MAKRIKSTWVAPDGTQKTFYGKTKQEAEDKRDQYKLLYAPGGCLQNAITFQDYAKRWYKSYKEGELKKRSEETILGVLNSYVYPCIGSLEIREIQEMDIMDMMKSIRHLSLSRQRKVLQVTKSILNSAWANKLIPSVPISDAVKAKGEPPKEPIPLTDAQCETLFMATKDTRVYPFLAVLRFCGLRKGEALGLMWKDIDFEKNLITVDRSIVYTEDNKRGSVDYKMKTPHSHRAVPMTQQLAAILREEKEKSKSLYVFSMQNGEFLSESSFRKMWDIIKYRSVSTKTGDSRIERTIDFDVHPHLLRHTCITAWLEDGYDIAEVSHMAGHASTEITMRVYNHFREAQRMQNTAEKIWNSAPKFCVG